MITPNDPAFRQFTPDPVDHDLPGSTMTPSLDSPGVFTVSSVARSSTVATSIESRQSIQSLQSPKGSFAPHPHSPSSPAFLSSPIRRKPLPPNVAPLTRTAVDHRSSITSSPSAATRTTTRTTITNNTPSSACLQQEQFTLRDLDKYPHGQSPLHTPHGSITAFPTADIPKPRVANVSPFENIHTRIASQPLIPTTHRDLPPQQGKEPKRALTMALHLPSSRPPPLRIDLNSRKMSSGSSDYNKQLPKTPGSKITSFFGWKSAASPGTESNSTEISDSILSPMPSPMIASTQPSAQSSRFPSRDSFGAPSPKMLPSRAHTMPAEHAISSKVADLENELREISCELAGSIRREMDLEDLVERLQTEMSIPDGHRRGSDYFSDSGYGSVKYPLSENGMGKGEEIEKMKRSYEQERAQMKLDLSQKLQEERSRRQVAESHVHILEGQVHQLRREKVDTSNAAARAKELETALEDTRRRLTEERQLKDNFEDLLTAMRVELEQHRNERDQLQSRMQQEIEALRNENSLLSQSRKMITDTQPQQSRFNSIAEEDGEPPMRISGLSRSNSLARIPPSRSGGLSRSGSLSRPSSMIGKERDFRESLVDRVKDVEMQRDALHQTVKSLLERQNYLAKQHQKRVRVLELEIDRIKQSNSPRRPGYEREVITLREEINILRRRADDALEQKWQCEKGLAGLKMDLDRAEQETSSLRALLLEHAVNPADHGLEADDLSDFHATSKSLEDAYRQLQSNRQGRFVSADDSDLEDALVRQVLQQVAMNSALRNRLAQAIGQGEQEQKISAERINEMQAKLKLLEETLILAQQQSEDEMAKHEQEILALNESHNAQLLRAKNGVRSPALLSPLLPTSPFSGPRSPRLQVTTSGPGVALNEAVHVSSLEAKVKELEKALRDADKEMEQVVGRMNKAQIEVAELQTDRDEALRRTRKLQAQIIDQINNGDN
ncbi:hypothetical protein D8B26_007393 [Coccidioides posadasii str. Silveira]|uniref:DUF7603 domain-containing protein n=1 Tax=Coccidioides posadasii (strain RMSCC 757 / Silveira) TaxID=443226 RepID=E9CUY7_COCPS|nr:conserved hypothetical protein [Coccidioides posadasii str. Silveira]QVM12776.1 hypothetical protein D8B26_007393 [Coccidioides posadasii str. Silveira]